MKQIWLSKVYSFLFFVQHKPMSEITLGLHYGIYHQGKLRVNRYNPFEAYVGSESIGDEIIIYGCQNMNRAFDGDIVAIEPFASRLVARREELIHSR